jgi:transcription-repair coupling factor (superfamily II helicase)
MKTLLSSYQPALSLAAIAQYYFQIQKNTLWVVKDNEEAYAAADQLRLLLQWISGGSSQRTIPPWISKCVDSFNNPNASKFSQHVKVFPWLEIAPYTQIKVPDRILSARRRLLFDLANDPAPKLIVVPIASLLYRTVPADRVRRDQINVAMGCEIRFDQLALLLTSFGYSREEVIFAPGDFAIRGGICDIYSPLYPNPARMDCFGDRIESLKFFDVETQRTFAEVESITIIPQREILNPPETREALLARFISHCNDTDMKRSHRTPFVDHLRQGDYFPAIENYLPIFYETSQSLFDHLKPVGACDPSASSILFADAALATSAKAWLNTVRERYEQMDPSTTPVLSPEKIFLTEDNLDHELNQISVYHFSRFSGKALEVECQEVVDLLQEYQVVSLQLLGKETSHSFSPSSDAISLEDCLRLFPRNEIKFCAGNIHQAEKIQSLIAQKIGREKEDLFYPFPYAAEVSMEAGSKKYEIWQGDLGQGFVSGTLRLACITGEALGLPKAHVFKPPLKRSKKANFDFSEVKRGDLVVHAEHGIGVFEGLSRLSLEKKEGEFLLLRYLNDDKLYLPVERMSLVKRYIRGEEGESTLDRLGGAAFASRKNRAREAIEKIAGELLQLYARRKVVAGHAFSPRGEDFAKFEADFDFVETADQLTAMEDVYADMEAKRPMDRLVCGDVGYGKTEVAMRACYRACMDGKQVAVIAPTTILVMQHTETFRKRFHAYPVNIGFLSRLQRRSEQVQTIQDLQAGKIDIMIGTHRMLSKDVGFPHLGLVVVDEEQRFGVQAKEKIKLLKQEVDVLTLTATPIPRTLQFSMLGLRDLSVIDTPPINRKSVKTFVLKSDDRFIRDAILKEMERGGQIFFVHNVVKTMPALADHLRKLVPECCFAFAHGQMNKGELEKNMIAFIGHHIDCLVTSAIIESGLDIPNVNTLIINRADRFGLAQLYQLRGRVGRSDRLAYAYLLVSDFENITKDAKKRLQVIERYSELGSGFKIAMQDLELRGGGNILGEVQSGHIHAVGLEMYVSLLENTIKALRGEVVADENEPEINTQVPAFIPNDFIADDDMRILHYRRLTNCKDDNDLKAIEDELIDRMGSLPQPLANLLEIIRIRNLAQKMAIVKIDVTAKEVIIEYHKDALINVENVFPLLAKGKGHLQKLEGNKMRIDPQLFDSDSVLDMVQKSMQQLFLLPEGKRLVDA